MKTLDVSDLPPYDISNQAPLWWGQLCIDIIEGTMFSILIAAYLYVRLRMDVWPPPGDQYPHLLLPTLSLIALLISAPFAYFSSKAAKRNDRAGMIRNMALNLLFAGHLLHLANLRMALAEFQLAGRCARLLHVGLPRAA